MPDLNPPDQEARRVMDRLLVGCTSRSLTATAVPRTGEQDIGARRPIEQKRLVRSSSTRDEFLSSG